MQSKTMWLLIAGLGVALVLVIILVVMLSKDKKHESPKGLGAGSHNDAKAVGGFMAVRPGLIKKYPKLETKFKKTIKSAKTVSIEGVVDGKNQTAYLYTGKTTLGQAEGGDRLIEMRPGSTLKNCYVINSPDGILMRDGCTLDGVTIPDVGEDAVTIGGSNCTIRNCTFVAAVDKCIQMNSDFVIENLVIDRCTFVNCMKGLRADPALRNAKVTNCTFIDSSYAILASNYVDARWTQQTITIGNNQFIGVLYPLMVEFTYTKGYGSGGVNLENKFPIDPNRKSIHINDQGGNRFTLVGQLITTKINDPSNDANKDAKTIKDSWKYILKGDQSTSMQPQTVDKSIFLRKDQIYKKTGPLEPKSRRYPLSPKV